jgi:hypothetical protein
VHVYIHNLCGVWWIFFVGPGTCLCRTIFWLFLTINHHYFFIITIHNINYDCPNLNNLFCNSHPGSVFKKHNAYIHVEFLYPCCYILHIYIRWLTNFGCLNIYGLKRGREGVKQYMHSFHYYHCLPKFLLWLHVETITDIFDTVSAKTSRTICGSKIDFSHTLVFWRSILGNN